MKNEELAAAIQAGDASLYPTLWAQVEKFVSMRAGKYAEAWEDRRGVTKEDLTQSGYIALVSAVQSYKPEQGSFLNWLTYHLQIEFAAAAGLRTERTRQDPINSPISLDMEIQDAEGATLGDLQPDPHNPTEEAEEAIYREQLRECLEKALDTLRPEDAAAIRARYFEGMTMREAGKAAGVSISAHREREQRGLRKLRNTARKSGLDSFIEQRTSYYHAPSFFLTHTSAVEWAVLRREELREGRKWNE